MARAPVAYYWLARFTGTDPGNAGHRQPFLGRISDVAAREKLRFNFI